MGHAQAHQQLHRLSEALQVDPDSQPRRGLHRVLQHGLAFTQAALLFAGACFAQTPGPTQQVNVAKNSAQKASAPGKSAPGQTTPGQAAPGAQASRPPQDPFAEAMKKYPGLLPEFAQLLQKLQQNVQPPTPRSASRLLPLLPESTMSYVAMPNYGDVAHQTLAVFRQELQESAVLRDWWTHGDMATNGPKIEEFFEKLDQFQQYLGEEIVLSGSFDTAQHPHFLAFAEIRKAGLDKFFPQWIAQITEGAAKPGVRVLALADLATAQEPRPGAPQDLLLLVRPDFVLASSDLATLRSFNAHLTAGGREFASSPFGQRITQEYRGGVSFLAAADIQKIIAKFPVSAKDSQQTFQSSGFADMKYAVWRHAKVAGSSVSEAELSFTGPRHGAAAWLAKPQPLGSLDFVSPKAVFALTLALSSFPQVFDDLKQLSGSANANTFGTIEGGGKALNLDVKDDLLSQLAGEFTVEVNNITAPQTGTKVIFKVNDADHLQKTLNTLLAVAQLQPQHAEEAGIPYTTFRIPNQPAPMTIAYAFLDGYLVIGSSPETVAEAIRLHRSGESLAKSQKYLASLPAGQSADASGLFYQNPAASAGLGLRQVSPELADTLAQFTKQAPASVMRLYGETSAIREASSSGSFDVGAGLIVAAIAIPNLLRSRIAANEASAVGSVRTVNTAEVTYSVTYPMRGFASNLAALGPDPATPNKASENHAALLDQSLANASCAGDAWCTKSGYQFRVTSLCKNRPCTEYVVVATPVNNNTGTRNFCSTSSGVIRYKLGEPVTAPLTASQCGTWPPLR